MKILLIAFAAVACIAAALANSSQDFVPEFTDAAESIKKEIDGMKKMLAAVTNQIMMQQYMLEERTRASGRSGVKTVRLREMGTKSYHKDSYSSFGALSIHDHANNIRTVGMGEFTAVLNGIEFKTRHNDYRMYMPHRTNMSYGVVEEVPFPDVPPSVRDQRNVTKAIIELQEYFRAWRDNNKTHRDYTNYFKPVLCYLEGAWTNSGDKIDEPFFSDRHFIDAKSWMELQQKARFVSYSGSKSRLENLANLPTNIMGMINDTIPSFAQFNFRILCHPLKKEVPLDRFRVVDDLHRRINNKRNIFQHERSRAARFDLSAEDDAFKDMKFKRGYLDELMEEIPGMNNYPGYFNDEGLDVPALEWDGVTKKDVSRYHRVYKIGVKDATGVSVVNRGFNDDYMFAAMTNHSRVAPMSARQRWQKINGKWQRPLLTQRWTWAIPLEIIYLTPLQKWNPYNLQYYGDGKSEEGKKISEGGRNGQCSPGKEFKGTNSRNYYITPNEFFGRSHSSSSADTTRGSVCVLDPNGISRRVQAAGIRSFLPSMGDLGSLRIRYPIFPVHDEGSTTWKELDALRELVMDNQTYSKYLWKPSNEDETGDQYYQVTWSTSSDVSHTHSIVLTRSQVTSLKFGVELKVMTDTQAGHQHTITLRYSSSKNSIYGRRCDDKWWRCPDGHRINPLIKVNATDV